MKLSMIIFVLCIILININFAQDNARIGTSTDVPVILPAIRIDALQSLGFSNISKSQVAEIGSANPASLGNFNQFAAGLGFQYITEADYVSDIKIERAKQWLPSAFGIAYPFKELRFGLSYHQKYNSYLNFGRIELTTTTMPDGTGEFYEPSNEIIIHSPSVLFSYSFSDLIFIEDKLVLGGQLFWDFWQAEEKILRSTATVSANDISWKMGIIYNYTSALGIGLLYEKGIDMEGEVNIDSKLIIVSPFDSTGYITSIPLNAIQKFQLPDKLSIGFHYQFTEQILLSSNLTNVFWNSLNNLYEDQLDFSASTQIKLSQYFDAVFGLYFTDRKLKEEHRVFYNPRHATYYNFGLKANYENFTFVTEFLNTTSASADYREQSIYKLHFNYSFNN